MPNASQVIPGKWKNIRVLYDDSSYSVIVGDFEGVTRIGERWNGKDNHLGFPNVSGYPVWHVTPEFLEIWILRGCLSQLSRFPITTGDQNRLEEEIANRSAKALSASS